MSFGTLRIVCGGHAAASLLVFAGAFAAPPAARAAEYAVMEVRPDLVEPEDKQSAEGKQKSADAKKAKAELTSRFTEILNGRGPLDEGNNRRDYDDYFRKFFFATLTQPAELGNWVDRRDRLLRMLTQSTIPPDVHEHTIVLVFNILSDIVKGNYHPAARGNAMLMIGKLNSEEGSLASESKKLPVPYLPAIRIMFDEFENPKQSDAVRAAALVGIQRHVELHVQLDREATPDKRRVVGKPAGERIAKTMLTLATQKDPPPGRSRAGHEWMRRSAIDILARLGTVGTGGAVLKTLEGLVSDEQESIKLRCSAAEALGALDYQNTTVNVQDLARKLGTVAVVACLEELKRVEERQQREQPDTDPAMGGMMPGEDYGPGLGMGMGPGAGPGRAKPDIYTYRLDLTRRVVRSRLVMVLKGLLGPRTERLYPDSKTPLAVPPKEEKPAPDAAAKTPAAKEQKPAPETPAKPAPKPAGGGKDTAPFKFAAGIGTLAKQDADIKYVHTVIKSIDTILSGLDGNKDLTALTAAITTNVNSMKETCGIVVKQAGGEELNAEKREALLTGDDEGLVKPAAKPGKTPATPPAKGAPATPPAKGTPAPPADPKAAPPVAGKPAPTKPAVTPEPAKPAVPGKAPDPKAALSGEQP